MTCREISCQFQFFSFSIIFVAIGCDPGGGDGDDNGTDHPSDIQGYKIVSADGAMFEDFGCSVSISGDDVIVGAHHDGNPGAAYLYNDLVEMELN